MSLESTADRLRYQRAAMLKKMQAKARGSVFGSVVVDGPRRQSSMGRFFHPAAATSSTPSTPRDTPMGLPVGGSMGEASIEMNVGAACDHSKPAPPASAPPTDAEERMRQLEEIQLNEALAASRQQQPPSRDV